MVFLLFPPPLISTVIALNEGPTLTTAAKLYPGPNYPYSYIGDQKFVMINDHCQLDMIQNYWVINFQVYLQELSRLNKLKLEGSPWIWALPGMDPGLSTKKAENVFFLEPSHIAFFFLAVYRV